MFACRVLPGAALVRATRWRTSALMSVDLPTFERPTSAIWGVPSRGKSAAATALRTKVASSFTGLDGRDGPASPAYPALLPMASVSNGVVDDGARDRLRLRVSRQPSR